MGNLVKRQLRPSFHSRTPVSKCDATSTFQPQMRKPRGRGETMKLAERASLRSFRLRCALRCFILSQKYLLPLRLLAVDTATWPRDDQMVLRASLSCSDPAHNCQLSIVVVADCMVRYCRSSIGMTLRLNEMRFAARCGKGCRAFHLNNNLTSFSEPPRY